MERLLLAAILVGTLALRTWNLGQNGWGAEYYSAAVRSMTASWHNFLYCSFDPLGFISVDKPPIALWVQVASVELLGYRPASLLLPQALEGTASVWLLHRLVRRRFGEPSALLAALFLAITPIFVAVNRTNNVDSCLVLFLLLAAVALLEAAETGKRAWLLLSMGLVGLAFNVKMLAAYIVLPAFFLVYFVGAPTSMRRRIADLAAGSLVTALVSLSWMALYDLTPAVARPFVGSSTNNSMFELTIGHNALSRFVLPNRSTERPGLPPRARATSDASTDPRPGLVAERLFVREPPGALRLAGGQLAAQASWLLPLAVMALAIGALRGRFRRPMSPAGQFLMFWACWSATYGIVYSYAGGIIHFYYLATLAPALAALAGIGLVDLWNLYLEKDRRAYILPATLIATALWQLHVNTGALGWRLDVLPGHPGDWRGWLQPSLLGGTCSAAAILLALRTTGAIPRGAALSALGLGAVALLALPCAWALSCILVPGQGTLPSADLYRLDPAVTRSDDPRMKGTFGQLPDTSRLVGFLRINRSGERFPIATTTTRLAAPIIISTGEAVMAMGGFHGLDPAITPEKLAQRVAAGDVRFVMLGDAAVPSRMLGADAALAPISRWVRDHGRRVERKRWRSDSLPRGVELYDMRPEAGLR